MFSSKSKQLEWHWGEIQELTANRLRTSAVAIELHLHLSDTELARPFRSTGIISLSNDNLSYQFLPKAHCPFVFFWLLLLQNFSTCSLSCVECPSLRSQTPTSLIVQVPNMAIFSKRPFVTFNPITPCYLFLSVTYHCWRFSSDVSLHYSLIPFKSFQDSF